jgi:nucleotide-binding universal stress UspA family protein
MLKNLLLAIDIDTSREVTEVAADLAKLSAATVHVLHCDELDTFFDTEIWLDDDTEPRTAIGEAVAELRAAGVAARGVTCRTGSPSGTADAVLSEASQAKTDIIVLGVPKSHRLGGRFAGSVAAKMAQRTTIPLLLVPEGPADPG